MLFFRRAGGRAAEQYFPTFLTVQGYWRITWPALPIATTPATGKVNAAV